MKRREGKKGLEDKSFEIIQFEKWKNKIKQNLRGLWKTIRHTNIDNAGPQSRGSRIKNRKNIWKIMAKNFSNLMNINLHVQEAQLTPCNIKPKICIHINIITKLLKANNTRKSWKLYDYHVRRNPNKINSWSLIRNNEDQKAVGWHRTTRKRLSTNNSVFCKTIFQKCII